MDSEISLGAMGLQLPSLAYIAGALLFGMLGWAAFRRGRKMHDPVMTWGGIVLLLYPYVVVQTWLLWAIGVGLSGWLFSRWR
jgi:hypothetical protein